MTASNATPRYTALLRPLAGSPPVAPPRDLSFRDISDRWMSATQKVMGRFFDSETTVLLDAMIEGLTLHRALGGEPRNPQSIRDGIRRIIDHRR